VQGRNRLVLDRTYIAEHFSHTVPTLKAKETFYTFNIGSLKAIQLP